VVGFIAELSIAALLRGPIGLIGLSDAATTATSFTVAFILATGTQMVFGELVPKNWAIAEPMRVGRAVAGFQRGFTTATKPLISVLNGIANAILRALGIEPAEELASARAPRSWPPSRPGQENAAPWRRGPRSSSRVRSEFGDRRAADVMTPRPRVRFIEADQPVSEVLALATVSGHARFPVIDKGVDDVIGMVHFKHAIAVPTEDRPATQVREIVHDLPAVPASMELDSLLRMLREAGSQMAVVVDEYGGTGGIVSLEDLIEEIVGEIEDEQDRPVGRHRLLPDGGWSLSGLLRPDEVEDIIDLRLPEAEETDTLGGLLTEHLGRLPEIGDSVTLQARDLAQTDQDGVREHVEVTLQVTGLDGRRADRVRLQRTRLAESGDRDE
jgi:CBS domain containing-hemolysin-like protein